LTNMSSWRHYQKLNNLCFMIKTYDSSKPQDMHFFDCLC
jgi:hypothetical protein